MTCLQDLRRVWALAAVMLLVVCTTAWGQAGTSSVQGVVRDQQAAAVPGATITLTSASTGAVRTTVTDGQGRYQFVSMPPGIYKLQVELTGFKTVLLERVELQVDTATRMEPVTLVLGQLAEMVQVSATTLIVNTTDASLGNVISGSHILQLPLEARNPVGLMSLQPGAVFLPTGDDRSGAVSGARSDQSNVTLDGVDVNDPQNDTAYTTVLRMPLDAIQEFRVTTTNYGAELGRSSGGQVSLITRTGTNQWHGSGYYTVRNTRTSSNEYFLKLSQLEAGEPSVPPKLDKNIFGGSVGFPIVKDRLFFFGNYEGLYESSESPLTRAVPSDTLRDGVLVYLCAVPAACPGGTVMGLSSAHVIQPGYYGLSPAELAAIDPLGIGPNQAVSAYWKQYPSPNDPGADGVNFMAYRFAAPVEDRFHTWVNRVDYNVDKNGSHRVFGRLNLMHDGINNPPQFPGQPPRSTRKVRNKGVGIGYDAVLSSKLVNTFRYGWTQINEATLGLLNSNTAYLRFLDNYDAPTSTNGRTMPTHNFVDDLAWIKGDHTLKFGTNLRFTRNDRYTDENSYQQAVANGSWVYGNGRKYIPGRSSCDTPGCNAVPAVSSSFTAAFADPWVDILGILSEADAYYNYDRSGTPLPNGEMVRRRYASDEYEFYVQDAWRIHPSLTVTAGVRYSIYSPPWETNGLQVAPSISLGEWFDQRGENAAKGIPSNAIPPFSVDLAGPANGKKGFYAWDYNNVAPRLAVAWQPSAKSGFLGKLTGGDRMVIRGGYSLVYDRIGQALATTFDEQGSFGLSTQLTSPWAQNNEDTPGIRWVDPSTMPPSLPTAPPGGFPQTPPSASGTISMSMDDTIKTPYAHMFNVVVGRELPGNFGVEAAYVGRLGRNLLVRRDLAMPVNLVDPKSGVDYYTAAGQVIQATSNISPNADPSAYAGIAAVPYWENLFPTVAGEGLTSTQMIAMVFNQNRPDWTTALYGLDEYCYPDCSIYGPFAYFNDQFDALVAQSSLARANYHAMQVTVRKRWSQGYQFDVNYTLSKSEDNGSSVERGGSWGTQGFGGYSGVWMNPWYPDLQWGYSDFDVRHQINVNWVANLPFGKGRRFGHDTSGWVNALIGDWSIAGLLRWTSGFPFNVINCRSCWATNWQLQGNAELVTPGKLPVQKTTRNVVDNRPSPFADPVDALTYFRFDLPGEVGIRNQLRGDGYFGIDFSLSKAWTVPGGTLRFRWDTFNLTNTPKFDTNQVTMITDRPGFGRYNGTLATCDGRAGRCMQFALHFQF